MPRPFARYSSRLLLLAATIILAQPLLHTAYLTAQSYEHTPFYKTVPSADGDAVMIRHASANGVTADISVASSEGGWNEGVRTDGWAHHEMVHIYLQSTDSNALFAYDLLLEPVAGTHQLRCTFLRQKPETFAEEKQPSTVVPLEGDLAPVLVDEGGTLAISMYADREKKQKITQYLRLRLSTPREQAALSFPTSNQACVRLR